MTDWTNTPITQVTHPAWECPVCKALLSETVDPPVLPMPVSFRGRYCWKCPQLRTKYMTYYCGMFRKRDYTAPVLQEDPANMLLLRCEECINTLGMGDKR